MTPPAAPEQTAACGGKLDPRDGMSEQAEEVIEHRLEAVDDELRRRGIDPEAAMADLPPPERSPATDLSSPARFPGLQARNRI